MTIIIVAEAEIIIITEIVITTIIATRLPISPAIVIVIRMPRSRALYIRDQITTSGSIY